jgi:hypothetical protein
MVRSRRVFILLSPGYFKDPMRMFESDRAEMEHNENDKSHPRVVYNFFYEIMCIVFTRQSIALGTKE